MHFDDVAVRNAKVLWSIVVVEHVVAEVESGVVEVKLKNRGHVSHKPLKILVRVDGVADLAVSRNCLCQYMPR